MKVKKMEIIFICDGETDYKFIEKMFKEDKELNKLGIRAIKPEDVGLKRRQGGGHKTLLKDASFAAMKAAQGFADGVFVLVDNDCDKRFVFPHNSCNGCRECEAIDTLNKIKWGKPFCKDASILYQAIETLILSAKRKMTPQEEDMLCSKQLKTALYGKEPKKQQEHYELFIIELNNINTNNIQARSYNRLKQKVKNIVQ